MSILGLVPHSHVALLEPRAPYEPISAEQFVERLQLRVQEMERTLGDDEQLEVVAFLPSGKAVSITHVWYENPSLVILHGGELGHGKSLYAPGPSILRSGTGLSRAHSNRMQPEEVAVYPGEMIGLLPDPITGARSCLPQRNW